jgi:hypothetical protein
MQVSLRTIRRVLCGRPSPGEQLSYAEWYRLAELERRLIAAYIQQR